MKQVDAKVARTQESLAKEVFRFHVLANSDSDEDQAVKFEGAGRSHYLYEGKHG